MFTHEHLVASYSLADDPGDYDEEDEDDDEDEDDEDEEDDEEAGGEKWYLGARSAPLSHKLHILLDFRPTSFLH